MMTAGSNGPTANALTSAGGIDGFLATWSPSPNTVVVAALVGGPDDDLVQAVSVSSFRITLAGRFCATVTCFPSRSLKKSGVRKTTQKTPSKDSTQLKQIDSRPISERFFAHF